MNMETIIKQSADGIVLNGDNKEDYFNKLTKERD